MREVCHFPGFWDDGDVEGSFIEDGDGERDAFDGDGAFVDKVAL